MAGLKRGIGGSYSHFINSQFAKRQDVTASSGTAKSEETSPTVRNQSGVGVTEMVGMNEARPVAVDKSKLANKAEPAKSPLLFGVIDRKVATVLGGSSVVGGGIGFAVGGPIGAAIGAVAGPVITFVALMIKAASIFASLYKGELPK